MKQKQQIPLECSWKWLISKHLYSCEESTGAVVKVELPLQSPIADPIADELDEPWIEDKKEELENEDESKTLR